MEIYNKNLLHSVFQVMVDKKNYQVKWMPHANRMNIQLFGDTKEIGFDAEDDSQKEILRNIGLYERVINEK